MTRVTSAPFPPPVVQAPTNGLRGEEMLPDDLRAGSSGRNIASGHEHADFVLPVLHVTLVLRHVEDRQQARERGQNDRDPDVLDTVGHQLSIPYVWGPYWMSWMVLTPNVAGAPESPG